MRSATSLGGSSGKPGLAYPQTEIDLIVADKALNLIEARIHLAIRVSNEIEPVSSQNKLGLPNLSLLRRPTISRGTALLRRLRTSAVTIV